MRVPAIIRQRAGAEPVRLLIVGNPKRTILCEQNLLDLAVNSRNKEPSATFVDML
jgi:hypothetical protein